MSEHPHRKQLSGFQPEDVAVFDAWFAEISAGLIDSFDSIRAPADRAETIAAARILLAECQGAAGLDFLSENYSGQQSLPAWLELCTRRRAHSAASRKAHGPDDPVSPEYLEKLRSGDPATCADFLPRARHWLSARLFDIARDPRSREAAQGVIDDTLSDLFGKDLLAKFHGTGSFQAWLCRVAENRLRDVFKSGAFTKTTAFPQDDQGEPILDRLCPAPEAPEIDPVVLETLKEGLNHAFNRLSPKELFIVRLVTLHGVEQQALARLLGVHPGTISKLISQATARVSQHLAAFMKSIDPDGDLDLSEYVGLAEHFRTALHGQG